MASLLKDLARTIFGSSKEKNPDFLNLEESKPEVKKLKTSPNSFREITRDDSIEKQSNMILIKDYLLKHRTITSLQAFYLFEETRLSSIIFNLKAQGYKIETIRNSSSGTKSAKKTFATYRLL